MFTEILKRLESAARTGRRAHLEPEHARALISSLYAEMSAIKAEELARSWDAKPPPPPTGSSSGTIGSNTAASDPNGASPGMIPPHVHAAAEALASEEAMRLRRRKRRERPLPATT
ncbi:hypothetical protein ABC347_10785 [Sphingomonas sp. 1P06PA]|uniref:hypothetical protein n=1 Tax=Sphingomonas sp. 1P06PA TaxID=554121 RepID=UPI0039A73FA3